MEIHGSLVKAMIISNPKPRKTPATMAIIIGIGSIDIIFLNQPVIPKNINKIPVP